MKKQMKKILALGLSLCMVACLSSGALAEELQPEEIALPELEEVLPDDDLIEEVVPEELPEEADSPVMLEALSEELQLSAAELPVELVEQEAAESNTLTELSALELPDYATEASARGFVYRMYKVVLGREPDATGLQNWVTQLQLGRMKAGDIVDQFFGSAEYQNRKRSNTEIVQDFYHAMLNREPDTAGLAYWKQRLDIGMTSQYIGANFVSSNEFRNLSTYYRIQPGTITISKARDLSYDRTYFVYRLYMNCLGRSPDVNGQENWCQFLASGGEGTTIANGFVFSQELWNKHLNNEQFVDVMYTGILGRNADPAGKLQWTDQLNYTNTREHVLNGFLFSQEFQNQCRSAGINVGNRIAEPDASAEWQNNIEVLRLVNQERTIQGLARLITREDLWHDVAMARTEELPIYYSHTRPDGRAWDTAYSDAGYTSAAIGENIAAGYTAPAAVVNGWMNSPGHRANILSTLYTTMATGRVYIPGTAYGTYWSQNFFRPW